MFKIRSIQLLVISIGSIINRVNQSFVTVESMNRCFLFLVCVLGLAELGGTHSDPIRVRHAHYFQPIWFRALVEEHIKGGGTNYSLWRPITAIPGFYPLGDSWSYKSDQDPGTRKCLLVYDGDDGKVKPPIDVRPIKEVGDYGKIPFYASYAMYELIGPADYHCLGFVVRVASYRLRQHGVEDFQNYRCVHKNYTRKIEIIDDYNFAQQKSLQGLNWEMSLTQMKNGKKVISKMYNIETAAGIGAEVFVFRFDQYKGKMLTYYLLKYDMLAFTNPISSSDAPLLVSETNDLSVVYDSALEKSHFKQEFRLWDSRKKCCSLGMSITYEYGMINETISKAVSLRVIENPNYVKGEDYVAPLARPVSFENVDVLNKVGGNDSIKIVRPICPLSYRPFGYFIHLPDNKYETSRCVHEKYVTFGKWKKTLPVVYAKEGQEFSFSTPDVSDHTTQVAVSTIFADDLMVEEKPVLAPVLRRESVIVVSDLDVAKIEVMPRWHKNDDIWSHVRPKKVEKSWRGQTASGNCSKSEMVFVSNITEPINNSIEVIVSLPMDTAFTFNFSGLGVYGAMPTALDHYRAFQVMKTNKKTEQITLHHIVKENTHTEYEVTAIESKYQRTWIHEAVIEYVNGNKEFGRLRGIITKKVFSNLSAQPVSSPCNVAKKVIRDFIASSSVTVGFHSVGLLAIILLIVHF